MGAAGMRVFKVFFAEGPKKCPDQRLSLPIFSGRRKHFKNLFYSSNIEYVPETFFSSEVALWIAEKSDKLRNCWITW
jgi:hypothetical protein